MATRTARRYGAAHWIGAVVVISAAAALITWNFAHERAANMGVAKAWSITGPPCPSLTAAAFEQKRYKAGKTFDYDGVTLGRLAGNANCQDVKDKGGTGLAVIQECQFTGPAALTVTSDKGQWFYIPGVGKPATIAIRKGVPSCVLGGKFTIYD